MNLIKHRRPDIEKIYLYIQDPFESKYQSLTNGTKKIGIKNLKNPKVFIDYLQTIDDVYESLEDYNATKKRRVLIADMKLSPIVVFKRNKTQYLICFYITTLFQST